MVDALVPRLPSWFDGLTMRATEGSGGLFLSLSKDEVGPLVSWLRPVSETV